MSSYRVAILDAGGQYVDLVKKAVERQGIPADVLPLNTSPDKLTQTYGAIIISGSPANSSQGPVPKPDAKIWQSPLPILGICFGMQDMVLAYGGEVAKNAIREDGRITTELDTSQPIFKGIKQKFSALFTHGDFVKELPQGFENIGSHRLNDGSLVYSAVRLDNKYGVQFHPEVFDDTPEGYQIFRNFLTLVAGLESDPDFHTKQLEQIVKNKQDHIIQAAGESHVIAFVSGGVDSTVATTLAAGVIPAERLHAFYIDTGFMRDEDDAVIEALQAGGIEVEKVNAVEEFEEAEIKLDSKTYGPLKHMTDPEIKRKIIGKTFVEVQNRLLSKLKLKDAMLLQGTNAADRIESGHSKADKHTQTIKTHHNQVKEIQQLKERGLLIEPLDDLFKDEIRELGRWLGLPEELVERQPFPGPGLAIRIIATSSTVMEVQKDIEQKLQEFAGNQVPAAQTHLLPIKTVGVGGDERSHLNVVALEPTGLEAADLGLLGSVLPAQFRDNVNRVIYALGPLTLAQRSFTPTLLTSDARAQLRLADRIVFEEMHAYNLLTTIKQFPVILLPLSFDRPGKRSIVLRPVATSTFMTVQAMLPGRDLPIDFFERIVGRILTEDPGISQVFLDLTNKPPATTEWE